MSGLATIMVTETETVMAWMEAGRVRTALGGAAAKSWAAIAGVMRPPRNVAVEKEAAVISGGGKTKSSGFSMIRLAVAPQVILCLPAVTVLVHLKVDSVRV